jgi:glycerophosphoryl diester phosphodiesterase
MPASTPRIIAHAGGAALGPANTLAAIKASLDAGVDAIEVDVWRSSDGVPVLMHDPTVDRTTNGSGKVTEMTLQQLKELDAGAGEKVPTLEEALELTRGRVRLNPEIKEVGAQSEVVQLIRSMNAQKDVWISSFSPAVVEACRWIAPEIERSLLFIDIKDDHSRFVLYNTSSLLLRTLSPHVDFVTRNPDFVELCYRRSIRLLVWTVNDPTTIRDLAALGVSAIFTDDPPAAAAALNAPEAAFA